MGVALQGVMLALANTVLFVTVIVRAGDQNEEYLSWAIFSALAIGGVITILQASRAGRLGAGHVLMTGAGPHFIAVSVLAMTTGGLPLLASLIVVSSLGAVRTGTVAPAAEEYYNPRRLRHCAHADCGHGHGNRNREAERGS